jgi:putative Ca2+/H+ antiporter (TMEM165/GDT1 family)
MVLPVMVLPVTVRRCDDRPGKVDWPIVHVPTVITAFATVFLAELPDKTMIATIVLSARFHRPFAVWIGAASALTLQMVIAVTAAQLLRLLPERPVQFAVSALFAIGAIVLWRSQDEEIDPNEAIADELPQEGEQATTLSAGRIAATVFGIVFIAEWGDLTQLATASLATTRPPFSVLVGASLAMISVSAIGVLAGRALLRVLPERLLHRAAAIVFATLAVVFFVNAVRAVEIDSGVAWEAVAAEPG